MSQFLSDIEYLIKSIASMIAIAAILGGSIKLGANKTSMCHSNNKNTNQNLYKNFGIIALVLAISNLSLKIFFSGAAPVTISEAASIAVSLFLLYVAYDLIKR